MSQELQQATGEAETSGKYDPKGVAPDAQLLLMSDFSLSDENLIAAYDDCLYLGADVINTSYGRKRHNS